MFVKLTKIDDSITDLQIPNIIIGYHGTVRRIINPLTFESCIIAHPENPVFLTSYALDLIRTN